MHKEEVFVQSGPKLTPPGEETQPFSGGICSLQSWQWWQRIQPSLDDVAWCFPSVENQESF